MTTILKKFALSQKNVYPFKQTEGAVVEAIPPALYTIEESLFGYYLKHQADVIPLPKIIYGSAHERNLRGWGAFDAQEQSVTIGLFGAKGAGKTLLSNLMAQTAIDRGMAVIDVSKNFTTNPDYLAFIESLGSVFVIFDEFLKKLSSYTNENGERTRSTKQASSEQSDMLTFLQGTNTAKRFTVMIDNDSYSLSDYIKNRPGRMRYRYDYETIEPAVVEALGADANLTAKQIEALVVYSQKTASTFDTIRTIVQEWLWYPEEELADLLNVLNVPKMFDSVTYTAAFDVRSGKLPEDVIATAGTIGKIDSDNNASVTVSRKNPYYNTAAVTREEYRSDDIDEHYESYDQYLKSLDKEFIEYTQRFDSSDIAGYTQDVIAYKWQDAVVTFTRLERRRNTANMNVFHSEYSV